MILQCPRCMGPVPDLEHVGEFPGPLSRAEADFDIMICSACGAEEAYREMATGEIVPVDQWPLKQGAHRYTLLNLLLSQLPPTRKSR